VSRRTPNQEAAIRAKGNVLVMAGAGSGKTSTLVNRCLSLMTGDNPVDADQILMVTFTEAAATEMRTRIREALEEEAARSGDRRRLEEQLALLDLAKIGTLHSFCLSLIREHFHELGLDPQFEILDDADSAAIAGEVLDGMFEEVYSGSSPESVAVASFMEVYGRGWDLPIRQFILNLHRFTQSLPDPEGWIATQLEMYSATEPSVWEHWLREVLEAWRLEWAEAVVLVDPEVVNAEMKEAVLDHLEGTDELDDATIAALKDLLHEGWVGKVGDGRTALKKLASDAAFLESIRKPDAMLEDWNRVRPYMTTLLEMVARFSRRLRETKFERAALDFSDLEQLTLELLLVDRSQPSDIAATWRAQIKHVFVDEFQDINAAQDRIIRALSQEGSQGNRFLVGDIKQSIYRFRRADHAIIKDTANQWKKPKGPGTVISLNENFRSHECILGFVNDLFAFLMRPEVGNVDFDEDSRLGFGAPDSRAYFSHDPEAEPRVECLFLKLAGKGKDEEGDDLIDLGRVEKEAMQIARRLRTLKEQRFKVWKRKGDKEGMHPVDWEDMVILLRSPKSRAESFAKVFAREGIPLKADRGGFFESPEVMDLEHLLMLLDNPLQDVPALTVLRSPLVGLSPNEMAALRTSDRKGLIWNAVKSVVEKKPATEDLPDQLLEDVKSLRAKLEVFLERFGRWRKLALHGSVSHCLETALSDTCYHDWLMADDRGAANVANVEMFVGMARDFEERQRQGLFRFLHFLEVQKQAEVDLEPPFLQSGGAVRLLSVHRSKGLEFPVVVFGCLGSPFNKDDMKQALLLDEQYGICPKIVGEDAPARYESVAFWMGKRHQEREALGEEIRLLYVALTRARDLLILSASEQKLETREIPSSRMPVHELNRTQGYSGWIRAALGHLTGKPDWYESDEGRGKWASWSITDEASLVGSSGEQTETDTDPGKSHGADAKLLSDKLGKLSFHYRHAYQTGANGKTSVSELRRLSKKRDVEESGQTFGGETWTVHGVDRAGGKTGTGRGAAFGTAHHEVMQHVDLSKPITEKALDAQLAWMEKKGLLDQGQREMIEPALILDFWKSSLGIRILEEPSRVRRELAFTSRFRPEVLAQILGPGMGAPDIRSADLEDTVIVQGVADLVVVGEKELTLVDFKTDNVHGDALEERARSYHSQLRLYAMALEGIFNRPVASAVLCFLVSGEQREVPLKSIPPEESHVFSG